MFWVYFCIFFIACFGAGATGGLFPPDAWYRNLDKPSWTPPDWVFPVTWTTLYVCMAWAGAIVAGRPDGGLALALWAMQIAINGLWTPVFFGLKNLKLGMVVVSILWVAVLATMIALWRVDTLAGALFAPYLLWVTIASALNWSVWKRNPGADQAPQA